MMKISEMVKKTEDAKAAAKANKNHHNAYETVLDIFQNKIQGAEMLPGSILKVIVDPTVGDEFDEAMRELGGVLRLNAVSLWKSTTSRGIIVEGLNPSNLDEDWEIFIEALKVRAEL